MYMIKYIVVAVLDYTTTDGIRHIYVSDTVVMCNDRRQTNQRTEPSARGSSPWDTALCTVPTK